MKKLMALVVAAVSAGTVCAGDRGATIFSDRFDTPATFAENWVSRPGTVSKDGVVHSDGQSLRWRGQVPEEYVLEADVRVKPDYKAPTNGTHWIGFFLDGQQRFQIQPCGAAFVIANGATCYGALKDYTVGDWAHLKLIKKRTGTVTKYAFFVNGHQICRFADTKPFRQDPIEFLGFTRHEIDNVVISRVRHEEDSNNLAFNGGFEIDEEGVPPFFNFLGSFNWKLPLDAYETEYLHRFAVDRDVKHSGRQSLRLTFGPSCADNLFWPFQVGGVAGQPAVMSIWMKTDVPGGVEAELSYGKRRDVHVTGDWARYEVGTTNLGPTYVYSRGAIKVKVPKGLRGHVWFDDLQAENVPMPEGGLFDYEKKTYATPFRPSELDRDIVRTVPPPPAPEKPGFRHPAAYRPGVLGRFDFYMNEKEAAWRVTDANGRAKIVTKPMDEIPMGTNAVTFVLDGKTYTDTVIRLPYRKGATQVNRWTRSLVHDGEKVAFVGLYVRPVGSPHDDLGQNYDPMFRLLRSKGFRHATILSHFNRQRKYPYPGLEATVACLDAAQANGLLLLDGWFGGRAFYDKEMGIPTDPNQLTFPEIQALYAKYDNVLSHIVYDEPELSGTKDDWVRTRLKWVKRHYPYMPIQMNNSAIAIPRRYAGLETDIVMIDDFLTNAKGRDVAGVVGNMDDMLWTDDAKPCWFFLSGDVLTNHHRSPTYGEQVAQSWGIFCTGGTGISWFLDFPHFENNWRAMVDVNREVQQLAPALLSEELADQSSCSASWQAIRHLTRRYDGAWYVFSVNLHAGAMKDVTFTLPKDAPRNGTVEVLFENRTLPLKDGTFTDDYAGHVRHIYRIRE